MFCHLALDTQLLTLTCLTLLFSGTQCGIMNLKQSSEIRNYAHVMRTSLSLLLCKYLEENILLQIWVSTNLLLILQVKVMDSVCFLGQTPCFLKFCMPCVYHIKWFRMRGLYRFVEMKRKQMIQYCSSIFFRIYCASFTCGFSILLEVMRDSD